MKKKEVNIERRYIKKVYIQRGGTYGGKEMEIHTKRGKGRYIRRGERRGTHGREEMKVHTKRGKRMYMLRGERGGRHREEVHTHGGEEVEVHSKNEKGRNPTFVLALLGYIYTLCINYPFYIGISPSREHTLFNASSICVPFLCIPASCLLLTSFFFVCNIPIICSY